MRLPGLLLGFVALSLDVFGQHDWGKAFQKVLRLKQVGKEMYFSRNKVNDYDSLVLIYLGTIQTDRGRIVKIIATRNYFGPGPHGGGNIILFNQRNQYIGEYNMYSTTDIPVRIEDRSLVFVTDEEDRQCTTGLITKVSFKKGIPRSFFVYCKGGMGEIYDYNQGKYGY